MANQTIGGASVASGVKVTTIRFYEDRGLLAEAPRTAGGRRVYDAAAIARLRFIKHARELGFDLDDITELLTLSDTPDADCSVADSIAHQQLDAVTRRINQLQDLQRELRRMTRECTGGTVAGCRVIESLADHNYCTADHGKI